MLTFAARVRCGRGLAARHAVAASIRRADDGSALFFAEVACPHCKQSSICSFGRVPLSVTLFEKGMTDAVTGDGHDLFRRTARHGKATEERAALDAMDGHEDFLRRIGLTPEQIEAWATYKPNDDQPPKENLDSTKE